MLTRTALLSLLALLAFSLPARAQLLWVTGDYRVVVLDSEHHRIGISLLSAPDQTRRQNWCYLTMNTKLVRKVYDAEGWMREEPVPAHNILEELKPGDVVRIHGGRAFDLSITARTIWVERKPE